MKIKFVLLFAVCFFFSTVCVAQDTISIAKDSVTVFRNGHNGNNYIDIIEKKRYNDFRIAAGGGYSYRLGERIKDSDPKLDRLSKDLMHGFNIDVDLQYFFHEIFGVGANINYVKTSGSVNDVYISQYGRVDHASESNSFFYIGPSFLIRGDYNKFLLSGCLGFGALSYDDKLTVDGAKIEGSTTTLGVNLGVGGEYKMTQHLGVGIKLSYVIGSVDSMKYKKKSTNDSYEVKFKDKPLSLSNIMITGFLSFRSW